MYQGLNLKEWRLKYQMAIKIPAPPANTEKQETKFPNFIVNFNHTKDTPTLSSNNTFIASSVIAICLIGFAVLLIRRKRVI